MKEIQENKYTQDEYAVMDEEELMDDIEYWINKEVDEIIKG